MITPSHLMPHCLLTSSLTYFYFPAKTARERRQTGSDAVFAPQFGARESWAEDSHGKGSILVYVIIN